MLRKAASWLWNDTSHTQGYWESKGFTDTNNLSVELVFLSIESFYERSKAFDINMMKRINIKLLVLLLYRQLYLAQPFLFIFNHT